MTKEQFNSKIFSTFKTKEIVLINTNIYWNPEYIEYYENYHLEEYSMCFTFLLKNRWMLNIKHTPKNFKQVAKLLLKQVKINKL